MHVIGEFVRETLEGRTAANQLHIILLFSGERAWVCDEAIVAREGERIVGLATLAPEGEGGSGVPAIVGLYVLPTHRHRGIAKQVMSAAISRCRERGFEKVHVDLLSKAATALVQNHFANDAGAFLDALDLSAMGFGE